MKLVWDESAWDDYVWWQQQDRKVLKRINTLITDIQRNGNEGIGKPEPLKHGFQGYWSRRITDEHRLVYKVIDDEIRVAACRYHYERLLEPYSAMRCNAQLHDVGMPARDGPLQAPVARSKCVVIASTVDCRHTHNQACRTSSIGRMPAKRPVRGGKDRARPR